MRLTKFLQDCLWLLVVFCVFAVLTGVFYLGETQGRREALCELKSGVLMWVERSQLCVKREAILPIEKRKSSGDN
jgi:hypothetical protein